MYQVSLKIFDPMKVEIVSVSWQERNREKVEGEGFSISCFFEDIDSNVMSRWKGSEKGGKKML